MKKKIQNTVYGVIVADALGVPAEFKSREEFKKNLVTDMLAMELIIFLKVHGLMILV